MIGVKFDDLHSFDDFGLLLTSKEIGTPDPKTLTVDVNGANGVLDLSEALTGYVQYKNRKLSFTFQVFAGIDRWVAAYNKLLSSIHGKMMKIVLDEDQKYFYKGRVKVNKWTSQKSLNTIEVEVDAEPFKYNVKSSDETWIWDSFSFVNGVIYQTSYTVNGTLDARIPNEQMVVCPEFEASEEMQVVFKGNTYTIAEGTSQLFEIMLEEGINEIQFIGNGTVQVKFRGGTF
jgi:hypothetical protein